MDISADGKYLFTCAFLSVNTSVNSVADDRVYNESSSDLSTREKNSTFSTALDQITSAFMRYVNFDQDDRGHDEKPTTMSRHTHLSLEDISLKQSCDFLPVVIDQIFYLVDFSSRNWNKLSVHFSRHHSFHPEK